MTIMQEQQSRREAYTLQAGQTFYSDVQKEWLTVLDVDRQFSYLAGWQVFVRSQRCLTVLDARAVVSVAS